VTNAGGTVNTTDHTARISGVTNFSDWTLAITENGKEFVAEFLYAGTRAEFVAHLNQEVQFGLWYGNTFLLVGVLITILELRQLWLFLCEED
jgi:hypothetical protein